MLENALKNHPKSLYVHIPYCDHICHYCDFTKMLSNPSQAVHYIDQLLKEVTSYGVHQYDTIFFGGGTPTALEDQEFKKLCEGIAPFAAHGCEWTVECNVESTTPSKLSIMKDAGVNRLSIGVQTFKPSALKSLNRHHNHEQIISTIAEAKKMGFRRINVDLIYDLPGVSDDDLDSDLNAFLDLDVNHIATYALTIHPNTVFGIQKIQPAHDDVSRKHYEMIYSKLTAKGYQRYEVSNFARNGDYSRHNLTYWRNHEYIGCGLGASGYLNRVRYTNTKNMTKYLQGMWRHQEEQIDDAMKRFEYIMLNFRLSDGFLRNEYLELFGQTFENHYAHVLPKLIHDGLIETSQERVFLTFDGMLLLDYVVLKLTKESF